MWGNGGGGGGGGDGSDGGGSDGVGSDGGGGVWRERTYTHTYIYMTSVFQFPPTESIYKALVSQEIIV